jgi:flavorubredoxin
MKKIKYLYTNDDHKWAVIAKDPEKASYLIDTNEYAIFKSGKLMLLDPGGMEVFPPVLSAIATEVDPRNIDYIFASHQDPDIVSSLALWLEINPSIKCYTSYVWSGFLPHYGGDEKTFVSLPDDGGSPIHFEGLELKFIPAHYLHSSGNFHLYDPEAKILFSGDIGAALLPKEFPLDQMFVEDFENHIQYMEGFHRRWMPSNQAKNRWCERVSKLDIQMMCPQHGLIFQGDHVKQFIDWFSNLEVGLTKE